MLCAATAFRHDVRFSPRVVGGMVVVGGGGGLVGVDSLGLTEFGKLQDYCSRMARRRGFLSRGEEYGTGAGSSVTHMSRS